MNIKRILPLGILATTIAVGVACSDGIHDPAVTAPAASTDTLPAEAYDVPVDGINRAALRAVAVTPGALDTSIRADIHLQGGPVMTLDASSSKEKLSGTIRLAGAGYKFELTASAVMFHNSTDQENVTFFHYHDGEETLDLTSSARDTVFAENLQRFPYHALTAALRSLAVKDGSLGRILDQLDVADALVRDALGAREVPTWARPAGAGAPHLILADGTASSPPPPGTGSGPPPAPSSPPDGGTCSQVKSGKTTGPALTLEVGGGVATLSGVADSASLSSTGWDKDTTFTVSCKSDSGGSITADKCYYVIDGGLSNSTAEVKTGYSYAYCEAKGYVCDSRMDPDQAQAGAVDVKIDGIVKFHTDACSASGDAKFRTLGRMDGQVWACTDPNGKITGKGGSGSVKCAFDDGATL